MTGALTGTSTPNQRGFENKIKEKVFDIAQNSWSEASSSSGLLSYPG